MPGDMHLDYSRCTMRWWLPLAGQPDDALRKQQGYGLDDRSRSFVSSCIIFTCKRKDCMGPFLQKGHGNISFSRTAVATGLHIARDLQ
jgi:hypothetical protein